MTRSPQGSTDAAISVMKEYTTKSTDIKDKARVLGEEKAKASTQDVHRRQVITAEFESYQSLWNQLRPPTMLLANHVSRKVEHGKPDEMARIELRLRLAELEAALQSAETILQAVQPRIDL